jgi:TPR repeat protein
MKRLLTTLVILTGLFGSAGAVWADAQSDFDKGNAVYNAGDYAEGAKWFRKSAEQGHAGAQYFLGAMYEFGFGVTQDDGEAAKWYRKAAEQGNADAKMRLAHRQAADISLLDTGVGKRSRMEEQRISAATRAERERQETESRRKDRQRVAATKRAERKRQETEDSRMEKQRIAAANRTEKERQSAEARRKEEQRIAAAKREQEERQADARSDLAKGGAASAAGDYAEAVKWWRKAAEQGNAQAQHNLGLMYDEGEGVTQDYAEAVKWYRKAAEQGDVEAQVILGRMYYFGDGILQDTITAHMWFHIAADNGHMNAGKSRDFAAGKLSSSDIMKAQQKAYLCMASLREKVSNYKECD